MVTRGRKVALALEYFKPTRKRTQCSAENHQQHTAQCDVFRRIALPDAQYVLQPRVLQIEAVKKRQYQHVSQIRRDEHEAAKQHRSCAVCRYLQRARPIAPAGEQRRE